MDENLKISIKVKSGDKFTDEQILKTSEYFRKNIELIKEGNELNFNENDSIFIVTKISHYVIENCCKIQLTEKRLVSPYIDIFQKHRE